MTGRRVVSPRLLGDIGGTNARFALQRQGRRPTRVKTYLCRDHTDLPSAVESYLAEAAPSARPRMAAFAVASPITGDWVEMVNHHWRFSVAAVRRRLRLDDLAVINDFAAIAGAVPDLARRDLRQIGGGQRRRGSPVAVIGPGTGLGVSMLLAADDGWRSIATEGGHATLAATNERESEVIAILRRRFDHVSAERALSGQGLVNLYQALAEIAGHAAEPLAPAEITARATGGDDDLCAATLDMFFAMLGTTAGNVTLGFGAQGGVYIAGGIVPKLADAFAASGFRARFEDKGRFSAYLAAIPAYVITYPVPAFLGLARRLDQRQNQ